MNNPELIQEVFNFAYRYMSAREVALITGADPIDLEDPEHELYKSFMKGRLMRKAEFNASVIQLSKQLSSPAMAIEHKIAEQTHLNDLKKR